MGGMNSVGGADVHKGLNGTGCAGATPRRGMQKSTRVRWRTNQNGYFEAVMLAAFPYLIEARGRVVSMANDPNVRL